MHKDINVNVSGPMQPTAQYKTVVLKGQTPFASQVTEPNTKYVIKHDFDLGGEEITIPENCVLEFDGGSLRNGTLEGDIITANGYIDAESIGIKYNSINAASTNAQCFSILSQIDNKIEIRLNGDIYLSSDNSIDLNDFILNGNDYTINVDNFNGFNIKKDIKVRNVKVIGANDSNLWLLKDTNDASNIDIRQSYFGGAVVVLKSNKRDVNGTGKDEIKSLNIDDCTFENIVYGNKQNIFHLQNTNILQFSVTNSIFHNFFGVGFDCSITNGSSYVTSIEDYYKAKGRYFVFNNNIVYNDINFKPWEKTNYVPSYFSFTVIEKGDVLISNCTFKNIIGKIETANRPVYDNYLSVNNLQYTNNHWENCVNLTNDVGASGQNCLIKAKTKADTRIYRNNTYILSDLTSYFENIDMSTIAPIFSEQYSSSSTWNVFDFSCNVLNLDYFRAKTPAKVAIKNGVFKNNEILINNVVSDSNFTSIFNVGILNWASCTFIDNQVSVVNNTNDVYFVGVPVNNYLEETIYRTIEVHNNKLKGVSLLNLYVKQGSNIFYVKATNNTIFYNKNNIYLLYSNRKDNIELKDNKVVLMQGCGSRAYLFKNTCTEHKTEFVNISEQEVFVDLYSVENEEDLFGTIICDGEASDSSGSAQVIYDKTNTKAIFYNTNLAKTELTSSNDYVYSNGFSMRTTIQQLQIRCKTNSTYPRICNVVYKPVTDGDSFTVFPKSMSKTKLDGINTSVDGVMIFNTTQGKMVISFGGGWYNMVGKSVIGYDAVNTLPTLSDGNNAKGTPMFSVPVKKPVWWITDHWIYADGSIYATKNSGVTTDRPLGSSIYIGFQYFDTTLGKPIYASAISGDTVTWVDATGATV